MGKLECKCSFGLASLFVLRLLPIHETYSSSDNEPKKSILIMLAQLGIFLCMRCAALHRKLGTHISKVKSLSMDSWNNDQVDVSLTKTSPTLSSRPGRT